MKSLQAKLRFARRAQLEATSESRGLVGLACIAAVAECYELPYGLKELRQRFPADFHGASLASITSIAGELGLRPRQVSMNLQNLEFLRCPLIVALETGLFASVEAITSGAVRLFIPSQGVMELECADFLNKSAGLCIEFDAPTSVHTPFQSGQPVKFSQFLAQIIGVRQAATSVFLISLLVQVGTLITPLFAQLTIDNAILKAQADLLPAIIVSMCAVLILSAVANAVRGWSVLLFSSNLSYQLVTSVFSHLLRLPPWFFEKRHIGDLMSRINSIHPLQRIVTEGFANITIDGLLIVGSAGIIALYNIHIALFMAVASTLLLGANVLMFPIVRKKEEVQLKCAAVEQSKLIETVHALSAIKLFGQEVNQDGAYRNRYIESVNASISVGKSRLALRFLQEFLIGVQAVGVVYLGAKAVLGGELTIGMLTAILVYRQMLSQRLGTFVTQWMEMRMAGLHLERLSDILAQKREDPNRTPFFVEDETRGAIELRSVSCRYSVGGPEILRRVSLSISPGDFVAFTGPSGAGKTTLVKVILGLLDPSEGDILIDGLPLNDFGIRRWRKSVGVVMQNDKLLSGTLADNISFFDPEVDMKRVQHAAQLAKIHDSIINMPHKYLTDVGDLTSRLSGGQLQRVLIARALYRRPSVLFLDEGTANLDAETEAGIADALEELPITRIVVAHRSSLISRAHKIYRVEHATTEVVGAGANAFRVPGVFADGV